MKYIPNILTIIRIVLTPFIIYLSTLENIDPCVILVIIASITDLLDGFIARTFHIASPVGAKLDAIADKLFGGCLIIALVIKKSLFTFCLIGEIIIAIINIIAYFNNKNPMTKHIGKIKTTLLYITIGLGFLSFKISGLTLFVNIGIFTCFAFQMLCSICYTSIFINYTQFQNKKTL